MGGLAGHMNHLYDNPELSFAKMKDIFQKASKGELVGTEKTDGQNLFVSYSVRDKKAKSARNKSNIKAGGLDPKDLAKKFAGRGNLERAFVEGFGAFEEAVKSLPIELQIDLFGPDANIFYNAEIMDPRSPNVVNYDTKNLVIHRVGHLALDKETGETTPIESEELVSQLEQALDSIQKSDEREDYGVQVNAIKNLTKFTSDKPTLKIIKRLSDLISKEGLSDSNTVGDFLVKRVSDEVLARFPDISSETSDMLVKKVLGQKGININKILATVSEESRDSVREFVRNSKQLMKDIVYPLEDVVHDFSVEALRGLESAFILDNPREVKRMKDEVSKAISAIEQSGNEEAIAILNKQLEKLKTIDNVSTASEGFVFDYDGKTYKFTGNFAPINQLLGLFKFGRGKIPPMRKLSEESEKFNRIVSVFPGKFKPPHTGHLGAVEEIYPRAEEVYVLISPREDKGVTAEASKKIWNIYLDRYGLQDRAEAFVSTQLFPDAPSPVQATYQFIEEFVEPEDKVILVLGKKDIQDGRYKSAVRLGQERGVDVEIRPIPPQAGGMSASGDMKPAMEAGDSERFKSLLPGKLTPEDKERVWKLVTGELDEISTSANVAGYSGKSSEKEEDDYMIKREDIVNEEKIRKLIRERIELKLNESSIGNIEPDVVYVSQRLKNDIDRYRNEFKIRECVRKLILMEKEEVPPHRSTGINVLQNLLKKIIPIIKTDFKSLTTDPKQRDSYRSHITNAIINTLAPIELSDEADRELKEVEINVDDVDVDKFIDIGDKSVDTPEEEEEKFQTLPGKDLTGRNIAMQTFEKIDKQIIDAYSDLDNEKDQKLFYDYLIANIKLYFDKFEDQLEAELPEPTTAAYEKEKAFTGPEGEEVIEEPPGEESPIQESKLSEEDDDWLEGGDPKTEKLADSAMSAFLAMAANLEDLPAKQKRKIMYNVELALEEELLDMFLKMSKKASEAISYYREQAEEEEFDMEEVSSEKQRKWACAQTKGRREKFKGELSLTPKEAEEMCSAEIEKPKN
jgi:phosphopantetheine adenylyltransferase